MSGCHVICLATLLHLHRSPVYDGDLVSKRDRDDLARAGLSTRNAAGDNVLTAAGTELAGRWSEKVALRDAGGLYVKYYPRRS